jgi:hypothetical protein
MHQLVRYLLNELISDFPNRVPDQQIPCLGCIFSSLVKSGVDCGIIGAIVIHIAKKMSICVLYRKKDKLWTPHVAILASSTSLVFSALKRTCFFSTARINLELTYITVSYF